MFVSGELLREPGLSWWLPRFVRPRSRAGVPGEARGAASTFLRSETYVGCRGGRCVESRLLHRLFSSRRCGASLPSALRSRVCWTFVLRCVELGLVHYGLRLVMISFSATDRTGVRDGIRPPGSSFDGASTHFPSHDTLSHLPPRHSSPAVASNAAKLDRRIVVPLQHRDGCAEK